MVLGITIPYKSDLQSPSRQFLKTSDASFLDYTKTTILQINVKIIKLEVAES